jgi:hypothetical protein
VKEVANTSGKPEVFTNVAANTSEVWMYRDREIPNT